MSSEARVLRLSSEDFPRWSLEYLRTNNAPIQSISKAIGAGYCSEAVITQVWGLEMRSGSSERREEGSKD